MISKHFEDFAEIIVSDFSKLTHFLCNAKGAGRTGALLFKIFKLESYLPPILNMVVPQTSQTAFVAFLPFFMVTS
jgi:hypothetical protein